MQGVDVIFSVAVLIMSVVAHEVSHGYVAYILGDPTAKLAGRLTLNPISHLDIMGSIIVPFLTLTFGGVVFGWAKPVPYNPYNLRHGRWGPAIVAAAGPLTNILIALFFGIVIRFSGALNFLPDTFFLIASQIVLINIVLAFFNFVPIPPLDGSKVLFSFLPYHYRTIQNFLEQYGFVLLIIFVLFLWRFVAPAIFVLFSFLTGL